MKRENNINSSAHSITEGVIWKQLLIFFFPIMLGSFFQQLYNTADAVIVGNFVGKEALAAVGGTTGVLINLLVGFFVGLSSGATVVIAQYFGARNGRLVGKGVHTAMMLAIAGGALLMITGILLSPFALRAMGTPEEIMEHSMIYIRIYFLGLIPSSVYNIGAGILRAVGDSKRPLYFLMTACLINIVLDLIFVAGLRLGVVGVGIGTVISQFISACLVCYVLAHTEDSFKLNYRQVRFTGNVLSKIIKIGLPAGLQSVMYAVSNIIIQSSINKFGTDTIAAWTVYEKLDGIFWMIIGAFGVAVTTFAGQNFGAGKYDRIKKSVKISLGICMGIAVTLSVVLILTGKYVFRLFTDDTVVIEKGIYILRFLVPFYFTYVSIEIFAGTVRGAGDALIPMVITCFGVCILRIAWLAAVLPFWHDIRAIMLCYPITWSVTSVAFIIYYLKGGWLKRSIRAAA